MHWTPSNSSLKKTIRALKDGRKVVFQSFRESYYDYPHSFVPLKRVYRAKTFDEITSEMMGNVLGTQGALWTEFVSDEKRIQFNTFPRLTAKAEVGWSPDVTRDYQDFQQRWQNLVPHMKELALINSAPQEVWDPSLYRQAFARFLDMRVDMQGEQKRWESKKSD